MSKDRPIKELETLRPALDRAKEAWGDMSREGKYEFVQWVPSGRARGKAGQGDQVLIPGEAAHHNEMIAPTVTG